MRLPAASACSSSWRQFSEAIHDGVTRAITASETSIARASSSRQREAAGMSARFDPDVLSRGGEEIDEAGRGLGVAPGVGQERVGPAGRRIDAGEALGRLHALPLFRIRAGGSRGRGSPIPALTARAGRREARRGRDGGSIQ